MRTCDDIRLVRFGANAPDKYQREPGEPDGYNLDYGYALDSLERAIAGETLTPYERETLRILLGNLEAATTLETYAEGVREDEREEAVIRERAEFQDRFIADIEDLGMMADNVRNGDAGEHTADNLDRLAERLRDYAYERFG